MQRGSLLCRSTSRPFHRPARGTAPSHRPADAPGSRGDGALRPLCASATAPLRERLAGEAEECGTVSPQWLRGRVEAGGPPGSCRAGGVPAGEVACCATADIVHRSQMVPMVIPWTSRTWVIAGATYRVGKEHERIHQTCLLV